MKAEPEKSLKAVSTSIYLSHGMPYPVVTFEDGSVWRRTGEGWVLSWQPEPKPAEAIADSDPVMTYEEVLSSANRNIRRVAELEAKLVAIKAQQRVTLKAEELRLGDVIEFPNAGGKITSISSTGEIVTSGNEMRYCSGMFVSWALARGVEVYRDGKLISGWPVGEEPSGGNAGRVDWLEQNIRTWEKNAAIDHNTIKELKTELATANAKFDVSEAHALEAIERAKKAESELAAAKNRVTEWANAAFSSSDFDAYERTPDGLKKKIAAIKSQKQEAALDPILSKQRVYATLLGVLREMQTDSAYGTYKTGLIQAAITALEYLFGHVTPNSCPSYRVQ